MSSIKLATPPSQPRILVYQINQCRRHLVGADRRQDNPGTGVFNPAISASPDGQTLTVSFYDQRDSGGNTFLCNLYLAQSFDGGATWQPNIRLTSETTDASLAPLTSGGYMLGDYLGIAPTTRPDVPAVPVWVDTRTGNADPFITRVGIAPEVNFTSFQASRLSLDQINDPQLGGTDWRRRRRRRG